MKNKYFYEFRKLNFGNCTARIYELAMTISKAALGEEYSYSIYSKIRYSGI